MEEFGKYDKLRILLRQSNGRHLLNSLLKVNYRNYLMQVLYHLIYHKSWL